VPVEVWEIKVTEKPRRASRPGIIIIIIVRSFVRSLARREGLLYGTESRYYSGSLGNAVNSERNGLVRRPKC